jgi:hypothetical protein
MLVARRTAHIRKLTYRIGAALSLVLATLAGLVVVAPSAFAHHPAGSGQSACLDDGNYKVTWTVSNSETLAGRYMLVRSFGVTSNPAGQAGSTTGIVANSSYTGLVTASAPTTGTIVAPGGSVGLVTTAIPAGTASVTLNLTGYWHYSTGPSTANEVTQALLPGPITVDLSKVCQGSLDITKTVTGGMAPVGTTFHVTYDNGKGKSGTVDIKNGETKTVTGLPFGSYTLAETGNPADDKVTINPNPAVVDANHVKVSVGVTNAFPDAGGFTVTKHVTGDTAGYVPNSTFSVHYVCNDTNATTGTLTLKDGETSGVNNLAVGTSCTLSETAKPATADSSYVYGSEAFVPSNVVVIAKNAQNNTVAVTLNNPINRVLGGFTVTKHVTGETAGYTGGTFTVHYVCNNAAATSGDLTLTDGSSDGTAGLPLGTSCTLSETAKAPLADASYAYGAPVFSANPVVVTSNTVPVAVSLSNPINRVLGGFSVTKHVTGETAGYVANSTFSVGYSCSDGSSGTLTMKDGETKSVGLLPMTTTCALSETGKPATTDVSYAYGTESWSPSNNITISSAQTPVAVILSNPINRVLGSFSVTKHVTGETAGYVANSTFTVGYSCSDGSSGSLTLKDGETKSVGSLPLLTTCSLSETAKPATTDISYAYGTESWSPSANLTINSSSTPVAVILSNPINRVLGSFTVTKHVTGETAGYVANSTFTVGYSCSDGSSGTLTLKDGETKSVGSLPLLTTCALSETAKPATTDVSYAYGAESFTPSSNVTINTNTAPVSVTLTNPINRVLGGFSVTKHVTGETAGYVANSTFTVGYSCSDGSSGTLTLKDGETKGVGSLPLLTTCSLSETAKPATTDSSYAYGAESFTPSANLTVNSTTTPVAVTLTNPINRQLGGFTVTKHVTGETAGYVANSTFSVGYSCSDGSSGSLTLKDGETKSVGSLPLLTTCSLSETAKPATTDSSYAYGAESFTPSANLTVNSTTTPVAVTLTNPINRVLGGFTVTKHVTGQTAGYTGGSFTVHYVCNDAAATSGDLTVTDGTTDGKGGLPLGTSCTLSETAKPATKDASYAWGSEVFSANPVTVNNAQTPVAVNLSNPINRVLGSFSVTKHVTGETAGYVAGSKFTVQASCSNGVNGTFDLTDGETKTMGGLPLLTTCTLVESVKPATTDVSYAYGTESFTPSNMVTINSSTTPVAVNLSNPINRVLGSFSVTKHVTGETAGYVADSTFTVGYSCSDGSSGTLTLTNGETKSVGSLPLLTTCTLSETAKPDTADVSYAYGTESFTPSANLTITSSTTVTAVTLTNPINRVVGSFSVTKHVTGETAGYVADSTFTVGYSCSDGSSGTLTLTNGETKSVGGLPLLTTCTLSETAKPATTDSSYAYGAESFTPSDTVAIVSSETVVAVTLTNPIDRVLGGFSVTKQVTGATDGYVAGSLFTVAYDCSDGTTGTLTLSNGSTTGIDGLPIGTTCTLSESAKPATAGSTFVYQAESWSPSNLVTIAANANANTVKLTLTNPIGIVPATVLGEGVVRPTSTLPVTGNSDTLLLVMIAGLLLLAGGCFVTAARIED